MTVKGHILLAGPIVASACGALGLQGVDAAIFFSSGILGAVLPDIDEPKSYIGRKTAGLSHLISLFITHRGPTHFLVAPILIVIVALFLTGISQTIVMGIGVGWLAHLLGDLLTKGGIRGFFYPFMHKTTVGLLPKPLRFYTGSITEYLLMIPLALANYFALQWLIAQINL